MYVISDKKYTRVVLTENYKIVKTYKKTFREAFIELNILASLRHPNIIRLEEFTFSPDNFMSITLETGSVTVHDKLKQLTNVYGILQQVIRGIRYLHRNNIVHLDIKTDNMVLVDDTVKLIDFGSAEYLLNDIGTIESPRTTISHRPPEQFADPLLISFKSDVWSLGIVIYEIMCRKHIYKHRLLKDINDFSDDTITPIIQSNEFIQSIISKLPLQLKQCMEQNYSNRLSMDELALLFDIRDDDFVAKKIKPKSHEITDLIGFRLSHIENYESYPKQALQCLDRLIEKTEIDNEMAIKCFALIHDVIDNSRTLLMPDTIKSVLTKKELIDVIQQCNGVLIDL